MPAILTRPTAFERKTKGKVAANPDNGKTKTKTKTKSQPYPTSRPLRDTARLNKRGTPAPSRNQSSEPEPDITVTEVRANPPRPPLMQKSSSTRSQRSIREDLGMPTREEFARLEEQYIASLDIRKRAKALISQAMFDKIWLVLNYPDESSIGDAQFRWWVRKMFALVPADQIMDDAASIPGTSVRALPSAECLGSVQRDELPLSTRLPVEVRPVVIHDGKRLAVREQIYDILCICHERVEHAGRDRTAREIRKTYTWVPKDIISLFIKNCPTCMSKKTGTLSGRLSDDETAGRPYTVQVQRLPIAQYSGSVDSTLGSDSPPPARKAVPLQAAALPMSANNLVVDPQGNLYLAIGELPLASLGPGGPPSLGPSAHPVPALVPAHMLHPIYGHPLLDAHVPQAVHWRSVPGPGSTVLASAVPAPPGYHTYASVPAAASPPASASVNDASRYASPAAAPGPYQFVQLPGIQMRSDIHANNKGGPDVPPLALPQQPPANMKVTLPSLSEVFAGKLTTDRDPPLPPPPPSSASASTATPRPPTTSLAARRRQPLQTLNGILPTGNHNVNLSDWKSSNINSGTNANATAGVFVPFPLPLHAPTAAKMGVGMEAPGDPSENQLMHIDPALLRPDAGEVLKLGTGAIQTYRV